MESYKILVGYSHGVKPANIVGAISNEAELDSKYIGRIEINEDFSIVDLPEEMPQDVLNLLKKVVVSGKRLNISRFEQKHIGSNRRSAQDKRKRTSSRSKGRRKGKNKRASKN